MGFIIVCGVVVVVAIIIATIFTIQEGESFGFAILGSFIIGMMGVLITTIILGVHSAIFHEDKSFSVELAALNDNQGVQGRFFLGSGVINSKPVFTYYEKMYDTYTLRNVDAKDATIKYTSGKPVIVVNRYCGSNFLTEDFCNTPTYTFLVPEGSITNSYTLDAK